MDTGEILANPLLGPLARGAIERVAPGLDPDEALFPITRGPLGLPSLVPVPKLERLYFKCAPRVFRVLGVFRNQPRPPVQTWNGCTSSERRLSLALSLYVLLDALSCCACRASALCRQLSFPTSAA